jgi:chromatin segregation and condensation protein Rec8/ScpA/Scc1 (kleisin family)
MNPMEIALQDLERWDQQLVELVKDERIDPWQIDLEVLTQLYLEKLTDVFDYRIPARAVITTAILLRLKAETMEWYDESELVFNDAIEYPILANPPVREPKRKITLIELVKALQEVMKPRKTRLTKYIEDVEYIHEVNPFDMNEYLEEVEKKIMGLLRGGVLAFSKIRDQFPFIFLALLFLAHEGKINLNQTGWNQEILIQKA